MKPIFPPFIAVSWVVSSLTATTQVPVLLKTLKNPTPGAGDNCGTWMVGLGSARILVSAPCGDRTATNAGAVYFFSVPARLIAPSLTVRPMSSSTVVVSWPSPSTGFATQQISNDVASVNWNNVTDAI